MSWNFGEGMAFRATTVKVGSWKLSRGCVLDLGLRKKSVTCRELATVAGKGEKARWAGILWRLFVLPLLLICSTYPKASGDGSLSSSVVRGLCLGVQSRAGKGRAWIQKQTSR
jgi:hypothetical protein